MSKLNKLIIYYSNKNKVVSHEGYESTTHSLEIPIQEIEWLNLKKITKVLSYTNEEISEREEVGEYNIRLNNIYSELQEKDIDIYMFDLEYDDYTKRYEVTESLRNNDIYGGSLIINTFSNYMDIRYDDSYRE